MVNNDKLDSSIQKFKQFVNDHPKMVQEVRNGDYTWQEFYEEWYLLGEKDPRWNVYKSNQKGVVEKETEENKPDWLTQVTKMFKKIDPNQLDEQINNLSKALGAIQGVLSQFQQTRANPSPKIEKPPHPFLFRKD